MSIVHEQTCEPCAEGRKHEKWAAIGEPVRIEGGKAGDTDHAFFQCQACGSVFAEIRDLGGLGGKGTFIHRLTKGFF